MIGRGEEGVGVGKDVNSIRYKWFFFCLLQLTRLFLYLKRHNKKRSSTEQASNESCYKNLEVPFVNPDRHT